MEHSHLDLIPPRHLILENGIGVSDYRDVARDFARIGEGIVGNMIRRGFIGPTDRVLDMGCGLGRLARPLVGYFAEGGEYYGTDIVETSIEWCRAHYARYPNFHFIHADVFSTHYNPSGAIMASNYSFPFEDGSFDFVWSTSLFTHLTLPDVSNYLKEMGRVLKQGGRCWNSILLMDDVAAALVDKLDGSKRWYLPHPIDGGRVRDASNPEAQIAFYEDRIRHLHAQHGLEIVKVRYGSWSGRTDNVTAGAQDVVIGLKP